jgi:hypothetical protein
MQPAKNIKESRKVRAIICAHDELNTSLNGKLRETYDKLKRKEASSSTGARAIQGLRSDAPICARDRTLALDSRGHGIFPAAAAAAVERSGLSQHSLSSDAFTIEAAPTARFCSSRACRRYLPFEELVETAERARDLKPAGLAQVMIWLQNTALHPTRSSGNNHAFGEVNPIMLLPLVTIDKA